MNVVVLTLIVTRKQTTKLRLQNLIKHSVQTVFVENSKTGMQTL